MNCWEVLGISPTEDQHQIKKAYAHAATLHHPEDDPDGFQVVYRAFKQAMAFAKQSAKMSARLSANREAVIPSSNERVSPQIQEENSQEQPDFDTSLLQGAASAEKNMASCQSAVGAETDSQGDECDYEGVILRGKAEEKKKIKAVLERMDLNYQKRKCSHSAKMWKQCFSSAEFLSLRGNEEFTSQFLTYQMDHIDIKPFDWVRVFAPMLREWLYYWPVGELSEKFHFLLSQRNKYGFVKKPTTRRTAKIRFVSIFLCVLVLYGAIGAIFGSNNSNSKNSSSMPSVSVPVFKLSPNTELGYLLEIEDVLIGAENHTDYSKLQKKCEELGISREKYEQMQAEYAAGDKESFDRDQDEIIDRNSKSRSNSSGEITAESEPAAEKQGSG